MTPNCRVDFFGSRYDPVELHSKSGNDCGGSVQRGFCLEFLRVCEERIEISYFERSDHFMNVKRIIMVCGNIRKLNM